MLVSNPVLSSYPLLWEDGIKPSGVVSAEKLNDPKDRPKTLQLSARYKTTLVKRINLYSDKIVRA